MTAEAKQNLFVELNLTSMNQRKRQGGIVRYEDIVPKKIFYGEWQITLHKH